jgi:hypothetical protein
MSKVKPPNLIYLKDLCFNEWTYIFEHCKKLKPIFYIYKTFNCSIKLFKTAIYDIIFELHKDLLAH